MKHIPQQRKVSFIVKEMIVKLGSCSLNSLINDIFGQYTAKWQFSTLMFYTDV